MNVQITQTVEGTTFYVLITLTSIAPLPHGYVFLYANTGTNNLGAFQGVVSAADLNRFQKWSGLAVPTFANALLLYNQAKIETSPSTMLDDITPTLNALSDLKTEFLTITKTEIITI